MRIFAVKMSGLSLSDLETTDLHWKSIDNYAAFTEVENLDAAKLYSWGEKTKIDFLIKNNYTYPKLAIFDMDSTLIAGEVINEMAVLKRCEDEISRITGKAMNGEIDFNESLSQRLKYLRGITTQELESIHKKLPYNPGALNLMKGLKKLGVKTYIASGGFDFFANKAYKDLEMDGAYSNQLEMIDNKTTGKVIGQIVNGARKKEILMTKAKELGINLAETIAVGDGANDLEMIGVSGFGIAYHAKPIVRDNSPIQINYNPLDALLYLWQ